MSNRYFSPPLVVDWLQVGVITYRAKANQILDISHNDTQQKNPLKRGDFLLVVLLLCDGNVEVIEIDGNNARDHRKCFCLIEERCFYKVLKHISSHLIIAFYPTLITNIVPSIELSGNLENHLISVIHLNGLERFGNIR